MPKRRSRDLIHRWEGNPVITLDDLSFPVTDICNAGAIKLDGEYVLLVTIQNLQGDYSVHVARSKNGYDFDVNDKPLLRPMREGPGPHYSEHGVLDARITPLEGTYYLAYDAVSGHGYRLGLARTKDFVQIENLGLVSLPDTKAGALFPTKIKGKYARFERPWEGGSIWISYSDDLTYWGWSEVVMTPRGGFWDYHRIGCASPPMEIDLGWLIIYYGIKETSGGPLFRLGAAILDRENPAEQVGRTNVPILAPREEYERIGDVPNLVFSCGAVLEPNNEVKLYYGAANSCICIGTTKLERIVEACLKGEKEF
ncbi:MAG: glycoside hydrolase family 130 protein [Candidatus Hydrogenedentes bacterium]|nr:glycoside hydrolase family 130 protein [Candidatus Hydrogenedentota bacterium]